MVYDIHNLGDLEYDLKHLFQKLESMYDVQVHIPAMTVGSLMRGDMKNFWASDENSTEFNKLIPAFKSLHRDMYSFIESLSRLKYGNYEYKSFESRFQYYKQFRELNNKFKHPEKKS